LLEVFTPHFGQYLYSYHLSQQVQIVFVFTIEARDVSNLDLVFVALEQCNLIPGGNLSLLEYCKVEARQTALKEALENIVASKLEAEFVAGHSGLCDYHLGRSNLKAVSDMYGFIQQTLDREVLPEHAPWEVHFRKLLPPEVVVFGWIGIDSLLRPSMHGEVRLAVSLKIKSPDSHTAFHWLFKDSGSSPFDLPRPLLLAVQR
jgi:hypothetical protein